MDINEKLKSLQTENGKLPKNQSKNHYEEIFQLNKMIKDLQSNNCNLKNENKTLLNKVREIDLAAKQQLSCLVDLSARTNNLLQMTTKILAPHNLNNKKQFHIEPLICNYEDLKNEKLPDHNDTEISENEPKMLSCIMEESKENVTSNNTEMEISLSPLKEANREAVPFHSTPADQKNSQSKDELSEELSYIKQVSTSFITTKRRKPQKSEKSTNVSNILDDAAESSDLSSDLSTTLYETTVIKSYENSPVKKTTEKLQHFVTTRRKNNASDNNEESNPGTSKQSSFIVAEPTEKNVATRTKRKVNEGKKKKSLNNSTKENRKKVSTSPKFATKARPTRSAKPQSLKEASLKKKLRK